MSGCLRFDGRDSCLTVGDGAGVMRENRAHIRVTSALRIWHLLCQTPITATRNTEGGDAMIGRRALLVIGTVAVAAAFVGVATIDAARVPRRGALRGEAAALHHAVMRTEERLPAGSAVTDASFAPTLARLNAAISTHDVSTATYAWRNAYGLALGSRHWEPMVEVGDAALALGAISGTRMTADSRARDAYLVALVRARRLGDAPGVLRVAEAFAALGDRAMAREMRRLSDSMSAAVVVSDF
jgi:hypothetical protein